MRLPTSRRSTSSCVSPGPRRPMPPPCCRDRCVHICLSRGSEYSSWASSTCSRASGVRARVAKMSRINSLRSSTLTPVAFSRLRTWAGRQVVVEDDDVGVGRLDQFGQLGDLALADVGGRVDLLAPLQQAADDDGAGGGRPGRAVRRAGRCRPRGGSAGRR